MRQALLLASVISSIDNNREEIKMSNSEKYLKVFTQTFGVDPETAKGLEYQSINEWDSVGHMGLIAELEYEFDITMETDDIIDFSSFEKGKEILAANYGLAF